MIPHLDINSPFPNINQALAEPNGLLASGADLSPERLINAYSNGIFPWFNNNEPILWWSPNPRTVFILEQFKPSRSLLKFIKNTSLTVTLNNAFEQVVQRCSEPRKEQNGTWINDDIKQAYLNLHLSGKAHSVEVWQNDQLIGGIYGVAIGYLFCGESMFSEISNGSKVALAYLISYLREKGFPIIDCQIKNPHLISLGATTIKRNDYLSILNKTINHSVDKAFWSAKTLHSKLLLTTQR